MLKTAVERELTDKNAAKDARLFKLDEPLSYRVLSYEEEFRLLADCDQSELRYRAPHLKSLILIALYTGLRRGEILRLKWTDIDFDQNVSIVRKSKTTSGRGRRVGLNSLLRRTLLSSFEEEHSEWVFPSPNRFQRPNEAERHIGNVKNAFRRVVRLSGIEPITFHQLRHTFCSRLANAGIPMPVIQDLAGHASIMMTRRYTHPSEELKQKAVEMLVKGQTMVLAATKSATKTYDSAKCQTEETVTASRSIR
jgi:integrase